MRYLLIALLLFIGCDEDSPTAPENVYGCTNQDACNFNPDATIFDDTCTYAEENYNCSGECINPDYDCSDLEALQDIINENNLNIEPLELGCSWTQMYETKIYEGQKWENRRLKRLILINGDWCLNNSQVEISIIPNNFSNLTELDTLVILNQQITELPESFGDLVSLNYLNLNDNEQLTSIPESITNLQNLRTIDIEQSGLLSLPENIGNLINLEKLYIYGNQLTALPQSICDLPDNCEIIVPYNKICKQYQYECININLSFDTEQNWSTQDLENCCEGPNGEPNWVECPE